MVWGGADGKLTSCPTFILTSNSIIWYHAKGIPIKKIFAISQNINVESKKKKKNSQCY